MADQIPDILKREREIVVELEAARAELVDARKKCRKTEDDALDIAEDLKNQFATVTAERNKLKAERDRQYPTQEEMLDRIAALEAVVPLLRRARGSLDGEPFTPSSKKLGEEIDKALSSLPKNQPAEKSDG